MSSTSVWEVFLTINLSFPVVVFSFFLVLSLIYWIFAALGLVDLELFEVDTDIDVEATPDIGSVSGLLMKLGLNGVPITIIITLISFFGWLMSSLMSYYFLPWIPTDILKFAVGVGLLLAVFVVSVYLTAYTIRPIRPFFLEANQEVKTNVIGQTAIVRSGCVDEHYGEANVVNNGVDLILKIRSYPGKTFQKGDRVVLLEHDEVENLYKVISEQEYQN